MLARRVFLLSLLLVSLLAPAAIGAQLDFPKPKGWVNDFAKVLDDRVRERIKATCVEVDQKTSAQIAVVTIDTTEGTPIGDYTRLLFNEWGIGHKEDNRGMLVLLSIQDHTYYISVGRGFETLFPNDRVYKIGAEMIPDLRKRRYGKAVLHAVNKIANIIAADRGVALTSTARSTSSK